MWGSFNETGKFGGEASSPQKKGPSFSKSVVPVCVRQIRDNKHEVFTLFGVKPQIVTLVCILRGTEVSSTKIVYKLEDHTGEITAVFWLESDVKSDVALPSLKENRYVRVHGSVRITDGVKSILVMKIQPAEGLREVTTHLLEVMHARYAIEKSVEDSSDTTKIAQNNPQAELATSMTMMYNNESMMAANNFTPLQQKIFNLLQIDKSEDGLSTNFITSNFPPNQKKDVVNAIEYLASEGHVYSTVDNDHFKLTN